MPPMAGRVPHRAHAPSSKLGHCGLHPGAPCLGGPARGSDGGSRTARRSGARRTRSGRGRSYFSSEGRPSSERRDKCDDRPGVLVGDDARGGDQGHPLLEPNLPLDVLQLQLPGTVTRRPRVRRSSTSATVTSGSGYSIYTTQGPICNLTALSTWTVTSIAWSHSLANASSWSTPTVLLSNSCRWPSESRADVRRPGSAGTSTEPTSSPTRRRTRPPRTATSPISRRT